MINALKNGDWAMLGMCALAFVPGMKQAKTGFKMLGHADDLGKAAKKVPNPWGKLGKPAHQAKVNEIAKDIENRGLQVKKELHVTKNGVNRYADVAALDKNGNPVEVYQVGKQRLDGLPISRERSAMADIEKGLGIGVRFIAYFDG